MNADVSLSVTVKWAPSPEWLRHLRELCGLFGEVVATVADPETLRLLRSWDIPHLVLVDATCHGRNKHLRDSSGRVRDWSAVRNLGWSRCGLAWRLALAGDEWLAGKVGEVLAAAETAGRRVVFAPVARVGGGYYHRAVAAAGDPAFRWVGPAAERVDEGPYPAALTHDLLVVERFGARDLSDEWEILRSSFLSGVAGPHPTVLLDAAKAAPPEHVDDVRDLVRRHLGRSLDTEERACACAVVGELDERAGDLAGAEAWYSRSVEEEPTCKSCMRLARARLRLGDHAGCVEAYRRGLAFQEKPCFRDDGAETPLGTLPVLVAALHALGHSGEARANCRVLREAFPDDPSVARLCDVVEAP